MKMSQKVHDAAQFRANIKARETKSSSDKIVMDIAPGKSSVKNAINRSGVIFSAC